MRVVYSTAYIAAHQIAHISFAQLPSYKFRILPALMAHKSPRLAATLNAAAIANQLFKVPKVLSLETIPLFWSRCSLDQWLVRSLRLFFGVILTAVNRPMALGL